MISVSDTRICPIRFLIGVSRTAHFDWQRIFACISSLAVKLERHLINDNGTYYLLHRFAKFTWRVRGGVSGGRAAAGPEWVV